MRTLWSRSLRNWYGVTWRTRGDTRPSHFYHAAGRYLIMHGRLGLWLGVDLDLWREAGRTPLWWKMLEDEWYGVESVWHELEEMFDEVRTQGRWKCMPIQLKTGVEKDAVVADAADQMVAIADRLVAATTD